MKTRDASFIRVAAGVSPASWRLPLRGLAVSLTMVLFFGALIACLHANAGTESQGKVRAFASILPIAYFVERVGGPNVEVNVLVGPGQDPHTFEPTPRLVAKLADAQVLFRIGFPFEDTLINKIGSTFKNVWVVDVQKGITLREAGDPEAEATSHIDGHNHKSQHSHEPGELDPHTWLDPQLAKIQAQTIADALIRLDPGHQKQYEQNLKDFHADLDLIHDQLTRALGPLKGRSFFVFHPAYGYFGDAYGLKQVAVQSEGKEPTARQLTRLIELARKDGVRIIFVQPQFSKKSGEVLAKAIGGVVVPLDDLAHDYLHNLKKMAVDIESALSGQEK